MDLLCKYAPKTAELKNKTKQKQKKTQTRLKCETQKRFGMAKEAPKNRAACSGSVLPHPHSHQQMCPSRSRTLSPTDVPHSAKLAVHSGAFSATRHAGDSRRACDMTLSIFQKGLITLSTCVSKYSPNRAPSFALPG